MEIISSAINPILLWVNSVWFGGKILHARGHKMVVKMLGGAWGVLRFAIRVNVDHTSHVIT